VLNAANPYGRNLGFLDLLHDSIILNSSCFRLEETTRFCEHGNELFP
jgi:hypothetical protein